MACGQRLLRDQRVCFAVSQISCRQTSQFVDFVCVLKFGAVDFDLPLGSLRTESQLPPRLCGFCLNRSVLETIGFPRDELGCTPNAFLSSLVTPFLDVRVATQHRKTIMGIHW